MIVLKGNLEFHEVVNAAYAIVGWLYDLMFFLDGFGRLTCPKLFLKVITYRATVCISPFSALILSCAKRCVGV